ncbi:hypothetical protein [Pseudobacteriovorax antillogorgiicola]|uniref:Fibronectin type-III domain-containing protein n=1 Tax=Pseudobacteriovorax antillogorgiicola TaxID=1513793 RepID=A0A1Y6BX85_9BACT|nr:hypothetical protein [Pseudobacteriovorax antillogorgiicola]TCS53107.1 hypothetical protein EDD56_108158 [Pseudobacteriovorax antillogorgiicola]SMF25662.1 hypothetical protein SAMN06296036_10888 [Pseudobacteriovorax antillogorgiicola]
MKKLGASSLLLFCGLSLSCDGDGTNPDTSTRDKLTPPIALTTVTGDSQIELRWYAQNFESELQGYDVFMVSNKSVAQLAAEETSRPGYPTADYSVEATLRKASVPRCSDNNGFFSAFGITVNSDESCDSGLFLTSQTPTNLQDSSTQSIVNAKVACYDPDSSTSEIGDDNLSLTKSTSEYQDGEGIQRCLIKDLSNGTTYTFIVVAVLGESYDEISWTSNLADDTPAPSLYSQDTTFGADQARTLTFDTTAFSVTVSDAATCTNGCSITATNTSATANQIVVTRDTGTLYPQRILVSTAQSQNVSILDRGPLTYDPTQGVTLTFNSDLVESNVVTLSVNGTTLDTVTFDTDVSTTLSSIASTLEDSSLISNASSDDTDTITITFAESDVAVTASVSEGASQPTTTVAPLINARIAGDSAIDNSASAYFTPGTVIAVYENTVVDFVIAADSTTSYYGKLVFGTFDYTGDANSDLTIPLTVIMQSSAGNTNYFAPWFF